MVRVENSHFSNTRQAHSIKSGAVRTEVIGCTITDGPDGTSSYLIEVPNGGALIVRDNTLEKGPKSENHKAAIVIGAGGVTQPTPEITITNNNLRNDGSYQTALLWNLTATPATLQGNKLSGSVIPLKDDGGLYNSVVHIGVDTAKQLRSIAARLKTAIMHWVHGLLQI